MTPIEILSKVGEQKGVHPFDAAKRIHDHISSPGADYDQINDTLMFAKPIGQGAYYVHFVSQDTPLNLIHSLTSFIHQLKAKGVKTIYMNTKSKRIIHALVSIGIHIMRSDLPKYSSMAHV